MRTPFSVLLAVLLLITQVSPALAASSALTKASTTPPLLSAKASAPKPAALSSCFDHYRFGSVQANLTPSLSHAVPAGTIAFTGTLTNTNPYPIVDAAVYARIFRSRGADKNVNGNDVVAFFPLGKPVSLKANQSVPLTFTWNIPVDEEPGDYKFATDVVSSDRFELSGLVFTDDVVGSYADFAISGNDNGAVRFDKESVRVGDTPFYFAAPPPVVAPGTTNVPIHAQVKNTTTTPFDSTVTWRVYYWDSVKGDHLLDTQKQEVKVHPGSFSDVGITVKDTTHSVYYIEGSLTTPGGSQSIVGIRFIRAGVNTPRLNFIAVDKGVAVACIHSTGTQAAENGHVDLTVVGNTWWQKLLAHVGIGALAHARYDGQIPGEIYALAAPIKPTHSPYSITATLSQNGRHLDTVSIDYTCSDLGISCSTNLVSILIGTAVLIVVIAAIAGILIWRRRKSGTVRIDHPSV